MFRDISAAAGASSQERKKGLVIKLLAASKGNEAGYVMRSLQVRGRRCGGAGGGGEGRRCPSSLPATLHMGYSFVATHESCHSLVMWGWQEEEGVQEGATGGWGATPSA